MNVFKTAILLVLLTLLFMLVGNLIGGVQGMQVAFVFALIMNFFSYWFSDRIVLAMYRGKKLEEQDNPKLFSIIRNLTMRANLPMPKVYLVPMKVPNAFATGRDPKHAAVAVTEGILGILNDDELEGVLAHELGHVKDRDILISTMVATIAGAIFMLANMARWAMLFGGSGRSREKGTINMVALLVITIIAPLAAMLIQLAISRSREYLADQEGAIISAKPLSLASALKRIHAVAQRNPVEVNPVTAHMFIVNPLSDRGIAHLFSTHPPMEKRIERLEQIAAKM